MTTANNNSYGLSLRYTLRGHTQEVNRISWSPDGRFLASSSFDKHLRIWDTGVGNQRTEIPYTGEIYGVAWSPDGKSLASCSRDRSIIVWNMQREYPTLPITMNRAHSDIIYDIAWSPDSNLLASGSEDQTIRLWKGNDLAWQRAYTLTGHNSGMFCVAWSPSNAVMLASGSSRGPIRVWRSLVIESWMQGQAPAEEWQHIRTLRGHEEATYCLAWSPNGLLLASGSEDHTIRLWDPYIGQPKGILEGHTGSITGISFSHDGRLLASKSRDGTIRIWRTDTWETVKILQEPASDSVLAGIAFHPGEPVLAAVSDADKAIRIWDLDIPALLNTEPEQPAMYYTNAKVVLVGDSGVGKSALGLALTHHPFRPTESTHSRFVYTFADQVVELAGERKEQREIFLWDLAGQSGYRLVNQLHLDEVAIALLVFSDNEGNSASLTGVSHWARALRTAQSLQSNPSLPIIKYLVEARIDRGGVRLDKDAIDEVIAKFSLNGYFATSAKEGWDIAELSSAIKSAINWEMQPKVTSTALFQSIKAFLVKMKEDALLLETFDRLYQLFLSTQSINDPANLRAQFETCIGRIESQGLIRRLSFGSLILMQPELIDFYASALINAVRKAPDGLGSIAEDSVSNAEFYIPAEQRIADKTKEHLLLLAMIEDLLRHEIALREQIESEVFLVFPSEVTRKNAHLPDSVQQAVLFSFEGPILNIYATLAIRLSHSNIFIRKELWRDAVTYTTHAGGTFGLSSHLVEEGKGEFTLFFDEATSDEARFQFEEYVKAHLERRASPASIDKTPIFHCPTCKRTLDSEIAKLRRAEGKTDMICARCETRVLILDSEERLKTRQSPLVSEMDRSERISDIDQAANRGVKRETDSLTLQGKEATNDFDVFLCHNGADKPAVKQIGEKLKERGILPWLDEWELQPGLPWQRALEDQIGHIKSAAVFVGEHGIGPWQHQELDAFLREFVSRGCPVIPVILDYAPHEPQLPLFLRGMTWVDFRRQEPDPMSRLIWGITGKRMLPV